MIRNKFDGSNPMKATKIVAFFFKINDDELHKLNDLDVDSHLL